MKSLRVVLTGANGQVAKACQALAPRGVELHAFTRAELDIGDESRVTAVIDDLRPDVLINAAGYTAVDKAETERAAANRGNAEGPRHLAAALAQHAGSHLVHISTDFVFDGKNFSPYSPDSATVPLGEYGRSKLAGELAVRETLGDRATIVRTAWVYSSTGGNFLRTMLRLMAAGPVRVIADQVGTPTSAVSLAELLWRMAAERTGGTFHWTDAGVASWYDFAVAIGEEAHACGLLAAPAVVTPIRTSDYPTPAVRPAYSVLDKSETLRRFGVTPTHWRHRLRAVIGELRNA